MKQRSLRCSRAIGFGWGPAGEGTTSWQSWQADRMAFEGTVKGDAFHLVGFQPKNEIVRISIARVILAGDRKGDAAFVFSFADSMRIATTPPGN